VNMDPEAFAKAVGMQVKDNITAALQPLRDRIAALEALPPPKDGVDGKDGADGTSVTASDVAEAISGYFVDNPIPDPIPGKDGKDGESVTQAQINEAVALHLTNNPPQDGKDGKDGADAPPVTQEQLAQAVALHMGQYPVPVQLGAPGNRGKKGKDGIDAFRLEDIELSLDDDGRTVRLRFKAGERVQERAVTLPVVLDTGVYKEGSRYTKGDGATWAGSFWIAQRETGDKPGLTDAWRLAVKRGADGKSAK